MLSHDAINVHDVEKPLHKIVDFLPTQAYLSLVPTKIKDPLGDPVDLSYLGKPFSKQTQTTPGGEVDAASLLPSDAEVDVYDVEKAKKRIIVMALQRLEMALSSKVVAISTKADMGLRAMAQFEGTRKVIEWDKRVVDDKDLLAKAEHLGKKLVELSKKIPPEKMAKVELAAAEALLGTHTLVDNTKN